MTIMYRQSQGSITIFLTLMLLPMLTLAGVVIDVSKIFVAKSMISEAGELTMNASLSEFDEILFDVYGLFAISVHESELSDQVRVHFDRTLLGDAQMNTLTLQTIKFSIEAVSESNLSNPNVLKRQILDYMKYRGPINSKRNQLIDKWRLYNEAFDEENLLNESVDSFSELPEKTQNAFLLAEYVTEMFSCDTTRSNSSALPVTLSGIALSKQNNYFFQKEVEYILWGNEEMDTNIQVTKDVINNLHNDAEFTKMATRLTYKDYLKLFIISGALDPVKEQAMLQRVAQLIEINISKGDVDTSHQEKKFLKNPQFSITRTCTLVELGAEVGVKTFILHPIKSDHGMTKLSNNEISRYLIAYNGISGY